MAENNQNKNVQTSGPKLNDQMIVRREKLDKIRALGVEPYGEKFEWDHHAADIRANAEELEKNETTVRIAGRIMIRRGAGKAAFAVLRDQTGDPVILQKRRPLRKGMGPLEARRHGRYPWHRRRRIHHTYR